MKTLSIFLGILFSLQSFGAETALLCNDQNGHAVYQLQLSEDLKNSKLATLLGDASILSAGTKNLRFQEGESTEEVATFAGKTNSGLTVALLFNSEKATTLKSFEILEVNAFYQQQKGDILSGNTVLLCSKK